MKKRTISARKLAWPQALALFVGVCLLLSLFRLYANHFGTLLFSMAIGPLACCAAGLVLFNTDLPRQWEFRLLLGILFVLFCSSALSEKFYDAFLENRDDLFVLVTLIFCCYALSFSLSKAMRGKALNTLIDGTAAVVAVTAFVGIAIAVSGHYVRPTFLPEYGIGICPEEVIMGADGRLALFTHPNSTAMICEITLLLSVYRILTDPRKHVKWLHGVSAVVCYTAIALAASRTATIAVSGALGLILFRLVLLRTVRCAGKKRNWRWFAAFGALVMTLVISFLLNGLLCDALLSISPANTMTEAAKTAAERDLFADMGMFTGRTKLWSGALVAMRLEPRLFLIGTSPICVGRVVSPYTPIYAQELHSSYVQMLVSGGVLVPVLFAAFLILLCGHSARLYFSGTIPVTARQTSAIARAIPAQPEDAGFLPAVLAAILVNAFLETFLLVYPQLTFASVWFFLLAGYSVCIAKELRKEACI